MQVPGSLHVIGFALLVKEREVRIVVAILRKYITEKCDIWNKLYS